jgi:hypothetical protein
MFIAFDLLLKRIADGDMRDDVVGVINQLNCFISTEALLGRVGLFLKNDNGKGVRRYNTLNFLNDFVIQNYQDQIAQNKELKFKFKSFYVDVNFLNSDGRTDEILELFEQQTAYDIEHTLKHLKGRKKTQPVLIKMDSLRVPINVSDDFNILEWSPVEIAKQLTVISSNLFNEIDYAELLNTNWTKKDKHILAPGVMKMIDRFNKLSLFIMEEILSYDKKRHRAGVIEKFIEVAHECRVLNNHNDCVTIITSLNNYIVLNLKKTWKVMNKQILPLFKQLTEFCTYEGNFIHLRQDMKKIQGKPCVPYLGLLLKDLAYIEEGPKYLNKDLLVNLEKVNRVAEAIGSFFCFKSKAYPYKQVSQLMILNNPQPLCEDDIETLANKIEPVYVLSKKKIVKKRLTNSDTKIKRGSLSLCKSMSDPL